MSKLNVSVETGQLHLQLQLQRVAAVIRIDAAWLATAPLDMRAGTDTALARVVAVFGAAHPHTAYLFANKRANRIKILVHDGIGIWLVDALLRAAAARNEQVTRQSTEIRHKQALIDKLTHENALLKRLKFAAQSERYSAEQRSLLDETLDADLQAVSDEIEQLSSAEAAPRVKQQPRRQPLPVNLPRREIHHESDSTTCGCGCQLKRIGEDVAEKLDYVPGVFSVERHIRGKWVCTLCETLIQRCPRRSSTKASRQPGCWPR